jgi:hypothetical protein
LIEATQLYIEALLRLRTSRLCPDFRTFAAASFDTAGVNYFIPYEPVHQLNVKAVLGAFVECTP